MIRVNAQDFVPSQRRILGVSDRQRPGDVDFPRFFRLYQRGLLDLDSLVSGFVKLDDLAARFEHCLRSDGIRTLVRLAEDSVR